jgi:sulfotransferase family protein
MPIGTTQSCGTADDIPASTPTGRILRQLHAPDETGRSLALLRTRAYRFTDDHRHYILAETLEEHLLAGRQPRPSTLAYVHQCLTAIRQTGQLPAFCEEIAEAEDINMGTELASRAPHSWQQVPYAGKPLAIALIVGAPRSGTSHLFNLLARSGHFGYFTTASCWAWPVRNLRHPRRHLFTRLGDAVLSVDNKRTRVIPGLVMPGEAEDIWARAIPAYRHIAAHRYEITPARTHQTGILHAAARAHLTHFRRSALLAKTPFNSLRIPQIEELWGTAVQYIHITRDRYETADSMRRNHFEFILDGHLLTAEDARSLFVDSVHENAPADRILTVTHHDLLGNTRSTLARVYSALDHARPAPSGLMQRRV